MAEFLLSGGNTFHRVTMYAHDAEGNVEVMRDADGLLALKGEHRSRGLKVVCTRCNNGWMSVLQRNAKPALLPFLRRQAYAPNRQQQRVLANWITMFSMVFDRADLPTSAVDQRQRTHFMTSKSPPKHWMSWVADYLDLSGTGPAFHRGLALIDHVHEEAAVPYQMNTQLTLGAVGGLMFVTLSSTQDWVAERHFNDVRRHMADSGFFRVWPSSGFRQPIPSQMQSHHAWLVVDKITELLTRQ